MPPQSESERIDRIESRVDRIETRLLNDISRIFEKLEALTVDNTRNACPTPGACVSLSGELQHVITAHNATMLRVERLELELIKLNQQKAWMLGAWSVIALLSSGVGAIIAILISTYLP